MKKSAPGAAGGGSDGVHAELLREPAEQGLQRALEQLRTPVESAIRQRDYAAALDRLAGLRGSVDEFFDRVLVNDPDEALRRNRLALLAQLRALFADIADLSRLPG